MLDLRDLSKSTVPRYVSLGLMLGTAINVIVTLYFLSVHVTIVYQNIYYLTIVPAAYFYRRQGLWYAVAMSATYLALSFLFAPQTDLMLNAAVRVAIFIAVAAIVAYLAERLNKEKQRYKAIFSTTESAMAIITRTEMMIKEINPKYNDIFSTTGKDLLASLGPEDRALIISSIQMGRPMQHVELTIWIDETRRTLLASGDMISENEYGISLIDITKMKDADQLRKDNEEFLRRIFEQTPYPLVLSSMENGNLININKQALAFFEMEPSEQNDLKTISFHTHPEDRERMLEQMLVQGCVDNLEMQLETHKGTMKWVIVSTSSMDHLGQRCLLTALYDITDRKRIEGSLEQANRKLNLLNSITRHDIVNQTVVLGGHIELLRQRHPDEKISNTLRRMCQTTENIAKMIEFTKDYQDLGLQAAEWSDIDMAFRSSFQLLNPREVEMKCHAGYEILADRLLQKVFYNLIDNSIRHGEYVTKVWLECSEDSKGLKIVYRDNGCGVADGDRLRLFEKDFGKNTGLGMFLTREILSITGITIVENGRYGNGARFEMLVPQENFRKI